MAIKIFIMDVDGTLTDGKIYMGNKGEVCKAFNIKDGCGIHDILLPKGITPVIITGRNSAIVTNRCRELGIKEVYQGATNKAEQLKEIFNNLSVEAREAAYIGDDLNDIPCMEIIKKNGGVVGCPQDAADAVIEHSDYVCTRRGGDGAVREFIEWIIKNNKSFRE